MNIYIHSYDNPDSPDNPDNPDNPRYTGIMTPTRHDQLRSQGRLKYYNRPPLNTQQLRGKIAL